MDGQAQDSTISQVPTADHERHLRELVHDMRVPVAALAAGVELLSEADTFVSDSIRASVEHLRALMKWAEASYAPAEYAEDRDQVDLRRAVKRAAEALSPIMRAKSLTLDVSGDGTAHGSPVAVARIVVNILGNAVRYAPSGSTVTASISSHGGMVQCTIDDAGPGFDAGSDDSQGWGMGLALSRELAISMGGTLEVLPSEYGASVRVGLPMLAQETLELEIQRES